MTPLLVLIVLIGVFPRPFLNQIRPAVARIDQNVQAQRRPGEQGPAGAASSPAIVADPDERRGRCRPRRRRRASRKPRPRGARPAAQERRRHRPRIPPNNNPAHPRRMLFDEREKKRP